MTVKILETGVAGFIGYHLAGKLCNALADQHAWQHYIDHFVARYRQFISAK